MPECEIIEQRRLTTNTVAFCFDLTFEVEIDTIPKRFLFDLASDFISKKIDNQIIHGDLRLFRTQAWR